MYQVSRNTKGNIYLLLGDNGLFKIGTTNRDPYKRIWEITHYSGIGIIAFDYAQVDNMREEERKLHKKFRNKRIINEWFCLNNEELKYIMVDFYNKKQLYTEEEGT